MWQHIHWQYLSIKSDIENNTTWLRMSNKLKPNPNHCVIWRDNTINISQPEWSVLAILTLLPHTHTHISYTHTYVRNVQCKYDLFAPATLACVLRFSFALVTSVMNVSRTVDSQGSPLCHVTCHDVTCIRGGIPNTVAGQAYHTQQQWPILSLSYNAGLLAPH